jgi:transposase-like protein
VPFGWYSRFVVNGVTAMVLFLRSWVKQADIDEGNRPWTTRTDAERIAELERENRELRRSNEILKAASAFMPTRRLCRQPVVLVGVVAGQAG